MIRLAVFKTGTHTDSNGNARTWTEGDLDRIASSYDPKAHEAPAVIGHPRENAPAFGWVKGLEREGNLLYANVKPTVDAFKGWVKQGLYKKRSISLYPDMTLRHVGFLGAVPPAVKGLPDFAFTGPEAAVIEFEEDGNKDFTEAAAHAARAEKHGIGVKEDGHRTKPARYEHVPDDEFADPVNFKYPLDQEHIHAALAFWANARNRADYSPEEVKKITGRILAAAKKHGVEVDKSKWKFMEGGSMNFWEQLKEKLAAGGLSFRELFGADTPPVLYTEQQVEGLKMKAAEDARATAAASFSEQETALRAREEKLRAQEAGARKKHLTEFTEGLKKKGVLIPAMEKMGMGITSFMQAIAGIGETYEFAEDGEDGKKGRQTPLEFMQEFLSKLPAQIEFKSASKDEEDDEGGAMDEKRDKAITQHMKDNPGVKYRDAVVAVSRKRPELFGREKK